MSKKVEEVIKQYPEWAQESFLFLRQILYQTAANNEFAGELTETVKWGEPAWLTEQSQSGTTIRIAWRKKYARAIGIYFHCNTSLVSTISALYPDDFQYEGHRGLILAISDSVDKNSGINNKVQENQICSKKRQANQRMHSNYPIDAIEHCFELALNYHVNKCNRKKQKHSPDI